MGSNAVSEAASYDPPHGNTEMQAQRISRDIRAVLEEVVGDLGFVLTCGWDENGFIFAYGYRVKVNAVGRTFTLHRREYLYYPDGTTMPYLRIARAQAEDIAASIRNERMRWERAVPHDD